VPRAAAAGDEHEELLVLADAWFTIGSLGSFPQALEKARDLLKPITLEAGGPAESPRAWALFAYVVQELGDYDAAEVSWRRLIKSGVDDPAFANNLAYVLLIRGRKEDLPEARDLAQRAVDKAPRAAGFHDTLARAYAQSGQRDLAVATFRKALTIEPQSRDALVGLADELVRGGTKEGRSEARRLLDQVAKTLDVPGAAPMSVPLRKQFDAARSALDAVGDGR
jgi:Flp pilus assembly protein TadD